MTVSSGIFLMTLGLALNGAGSSNRTPYQLDPVIDGASTAGIYLFLGVMHGLIKGTLPKHPTCDIDPLTGLCDERVLSAIDRSVVGNLSKEWRTVSDVSNGVAVVIPLALGGLDYWLGKEQATWGDYGADLLVTAQAVGATICITDVLKYSLRRSRPTRYTVGASSKSSWHTLSFPSGHTSSAAAASFAFATTFALRHPKSVWRYAMYGLGSLVTGATAMGRVKGGVHFYSDVIAGGILGATIGIILPYLHRRQDSMEISAVPFVDGESVILSLSGQFE